MPVNGVLELPCAITIVSADSPSIPDAVFSTDRKMEDVTVKAADVTSSIKTREKTALFLPRILVV